MSAGSSRNDILRWQERHCCGQASSAGILAKADSTQGSSQAVPHPSTNRALRRLTSEVRRDPVHSTRYGRQRPKRQGAKCLLSLQPCGGCFPKLQRGSLPHTHTNPEDHKDQESPTQPRQEKQPINAKSTMYQPSHHPGKKGKPWAATSAMYQPSHHPGKKRKALGSHAHHVSTKHTINCAPAHVQKM